MDRAAHILAELATQLSAAATALNRLTPEPVNGRAAPAADLAPDVPKTVPALHCGAVEVPKRYPSETYLAEVPAQLADALGALEQERAARQIYQREFSHARREVERLKASEAASAERERKLTDALRVGGERCAAAERARKVLVDQVAALHGWNPSDGAVRAAHGMLIHSGQSAIRSALRAAFVHDRFEAGEPRT